MAQNTPYKERFSNRLMDLGNLILAGAFITVFIDGSPLPLQYLSAGYIIGITFYLVSFIIDKL